MNVKLLHNLIVKKLLIQLDDCYRKSKGLPMKTLIFKKLWKIIYTLWDINYQIKWPKDNESCFKSNTMWYFILVLGMIFVNFLRVGKLPLWRKKLEWMVQEMYQFDVKGEQENQLLVQDQFWWPRNFRKGWDNKGGTSIEKAKLKRLIKGLSL